MRATTFSLGPALTVLLVAVAAWAAPPSPGSARSRLDGGLLKVLDHHSPLEAAAGRGFRVRDGRIQVSIVAEAAGTADLRRWLEQRGARHVSGRAERLQASVDIDTLSALQDQSGVVWVRRPLYAEVPGVPEEAGATRATAEVISEGVAAMNAPTWHGAGITGQAVRVGIIDTGFGGYLELAGGELPPAHSMHLRTFGDTELDPSVYHGTAMAEIIHDVAPAAELYLAIIATDIDFAEAIDWFSTSGVTVASMSLGWYFSGAGDGTGVAEDLIAESVSRHDLLWALPAGNHRDEHWQGPSVDQDGDGWIEFAGGKEILMLVGEDGQPEHFGPSDGFPLRAYLRWNDWTAVDQDYRVCLFRIVGSTRVAAACSDDTQDGGAGQQPCDYARYDPPLASGIYGVGVSRNGVTGMHDLDLHTPWLPRAHLEGFVGTSSLTDPGASPDGITTGAVDHRPPMEVLDYSALGPTKGPGGTQQGGRIAPDIGAYSGVSNSRGQYQATGTSSAVPHVAGAAALIRGARPEWSNLEVRRMLAHRAVDIGVPGQDMSSGAGRLYLGTPLPPADQCAATLTSHDMIFPPDGGSGEVVVSVATPCPWFAAASTEWIHMDEADAGSGSDTVTYTVDANPSCVPRQGCVLVAGARVTIAQQGLEPARCPRRAAGRVSPNGGR